MSNVPKTSPDIGIVLSGRYRVEELIARGGMATVYRGFDERLHRPVALKIMHPHLTDNPEFISRFSREARSAARLTHPHVVSVYDQGEDQGRVYLAMQLVPGETLRDELRRDGSLTVRRALRVGRDVLAALDSAHRSGIIHRDIKPENVLVSTDRDILVADFGLARAVGSASSSTTGTILGTVAYVSPEVVTQGMSDARSDLYSWGILMYEMLTGRVPFSGDSALHIAYQHVHEDIPAPSHTAPGIPPSIDALVTWAASRLPSSRPARAHEVLVALDDALTSLTSLQLGYRAAADASLVDSPTADVPRLTLALNPPSEGEGADAGRRKPLAFLAGPEAHRPTDAEGIEEDESIREVPAPRRPRQKGWRRHSKAKASPVTSAVAWLASLACLASVATAGALWYSVEGPGADRTVPLVAGAPLQDAEAALESEGLAVSTKEVFDATVPAGRVIESAPRSGHTVKSGSHVTLTVSKGEELFGVPDVGGTPAGEARAALEKAGFTVKEERHFSADVPKDSVISVSPEGKKLPKGADVTLAISDGPEPIAVPGVGGQSKSAAVDALKGAGFTVKVTESYHSSVPKGQIISQKPGPGGEALPGSEVRINVSLGPDLVDVPNVFKKTEADARAQLEGQGFKVTVVYERGTPVFGLVSQQSLPAGQKAPRGSTVTLTVY